MSLIARRCAATAAVAAGVRLNAAAVACNLARFTPATSASSAVSPRFTLQPRLSRSFSSEPPKKPTKLSGAELDRAVSSLQGWTHDPAAAAIRKSFSFPDFNTCWGVMSRVALLAEKMNHHPKWTNVYGSLEVELQTHDVKGVSDFVRRKSQHRE